MVLCGVLAPPSLLPCASHHGPPGTAQLCRHPPVVTTSVWPVVTDCHHQLSQSQSVLRPGPRHISVSSIPALSGAILSSDITNSADTTHCSGQWSYRVLCPAQYHHSRAPAGQPDSQHMAVQGVKGGSRTSVTLRGTLKKIFNLSLRLHSC